MPFSISVYGLLRGHFKVFKGCLFSLLYILSIFVSSSADQRRRQISESSRPDDNYFDESLFKDYDFAIVGDTSTIWQDGCKPVLIRDDLCNTRKFIETYAILDLYQFYGVLMLCHLIDLWTAFG